MTGGDQYTRACALAAAARSTVNPGNVLKVAERYAYWIEHGTDPGINGQMIPGSGCPCGCGDR